MRPLEFTSGTSDAVFIHIHECPRKPVAVLSFLPARFLLADTSGRGRSVRGTPEAVLYRPVHGFLNRLPR